MNLFLKGWNYFQNRKFKFDRKCVVLIYHRVTNPESDPQLLSVSPANFEKQIQYLKSNYTILSLQELVNCLHKRSLPKQSVVITFDDGYADNLHEATPVLEKYDAPATIFISSGMIGAKHEFWWDSLQNIFLTKDDTIFKELNLEIGGEIYKRNITNTEDAQIAYHEVLKLIRPLPYKIRDKKIEELYQWAGKQIRQRNTHATLSEKELITLSQTKGIEIGAHTVVHPRLSNESFEVQQNEIKESKTALEKMINKPVRSFSYPFGLHEDFTNTSVEIVKASGYNCGIANIQSATFNNTDLYQIPRRIVRDWDTDKFSAYIEMFFENKILE